MSFKGSSNAGRLYNKFRNCGTENRSNAIFLPKLW